MNMIPRVTIKFHWNGIKGQDKKLQRCWYSDGVLSLYPPGTITIYARDYTPFSKEVNDYFLVENDTDIMSDYHEKDRIRVRPTHPLYPMVLKALEAGKDHNVRIASKKGTNQ